MFSDENNHEKSSEKTLKELLYSLYPDDNDEKTQGYSIPFQFFQDILVKSVLSSSYEVLLRMIFYIVLDFFIVFSTPTLTWFDSFFPNKDKLTYSYISTKVSLQVVASLVIILIFNMIMIQWAFFIRYDPIKHLSTNSATFLHISFYYLPPILVLLLGFIFGCLLVLNSEARMSNAYCTFLTLVVSLIFILLTINYHIYCIFTRYSLIIRRGIFSTWEPPYNIISLSVFYMISSAFPFITSSFRKSCILFAIITLVWSLTKIYKGQKPVYISSIAYFIETKVTFDGVLFSILFIINIWANLNFHITTTIMQILFFASIIFSGIMSSSSLYSIKSAILEDGSLNQANFPNSNTCIMNIRISLYYSISNIFQNIDFLKWMTRNRFSTELIPEIVRLNFVMNLNLDEFQIPSSTFSPLELISLKFLAFQVRQYEKFILSSPEDPSIAYAIEEIQRLMQIVNNVSKVFWTNKDYEQLSIANYGKKVFRITSFIRNLALSYPHSNEIQSLWAEYSKSVIQKPSKTVIKHVHEFTYIENPGNTVYHFLNQASPEDFDIRNQKRIDSTTEHFVSTFVEATYNPIVRFYTIVPILIFLIGISFSVLYAFRANKVFELFEDNIKILSLSISLCLDSLNNADSLVQLPTITFISKSLHISLDFASTFRNDILISDPTYDKLSSFMGLFNQYEIDINISSCPRFTLGFMIIFQFPENSINIHKCHLFWAGAYARRLSEIAEQNIDDFFPFFATPINNNEKIGTDVVQGIVILIFNIIFIIVFIILTLRQRKKIKKLILAIENIVAMKNEMCERGEPYIGFSAFIYSILIILLIAVLSLNYIIYIFPIRSVENRIVNLANQTLMMSNICRYSTLAMASSTIEVGLRQSLLTNTGQDSIEKGLSNDEEENDDIKRLQGYIQEIASVRKMFVGNLINVANQLTICDMDSILKSATNWMVDSSKYALYQQMKNSENTNGTIISTNISSTAKNNTKRIKNKKNHNYTIVSNNNLRINNKYLYNYTNKKMNQKSKIEQNDIESKSLNMSLDKHYEYSSEIDFEAATMTSLSSIVVDFAELLTEDNITVDSFNFLMARLMYKINISTLLTNAFPEIATLNPIIFSYINESFWIYFVLVNVMLLIIAHLLYFQTRCQNNWFTGLAVLIRRAMAKYPERFLYIFGVILEDKPKYFDVLPVPIIVLNKKGTIVYANQVVMQYTKHTMDQTIGQPCSEFFTDNSTKYTDLTFSAERRSFINLYEKKIKKNRSNRKNNSENESDSVEDINDNKNGELIGDDDDCYSFVILRDTSKCMELQKTFNDLKDRVTPEVGVVPCRGRLIFIECRFQTESVKPDTVFTKIEAVSLKYKTKKIDKKINNIKKHFLNQNVKSSSSSDNENDNDNKNDEEDNKNKNDEEDNKNKNDDEDNKNKNDEEDNKNKNDEEDNKNKNDEEDNKNKNDEKDNKNKNDEEDNDNDNDEEDNKNKNDEKDNDNDEEDNGNEEEDNNNDNNDDNSFDIFNFFDFKDEEDQFNDRCVTVISCGTSYLNAVARIGCEEEAIRFVLDLSSGIFMNFRASITEGVGTVLSILEGGSIVVVAGEVSRRATDANLFGLWGRIYIDYSIIERSGMEKELSNDEFDKYEKSDNSEKSAKNSNLNLNLSKFGGLNNGLNKANQGEQPPKLPGMPSLLPGLLGQKGPQGGPPAVQPPQQPPQGGKFGLAKFGLGFGINKPASSQAALNLKKPLIISISPMSKL